MRVWQPARLSAYLQSIAALALIIDVIHQIHFASIQLPLAAWVGRPWCLCWHPVLLGLLGRKLWRPADELSSAYESKTKQTSHFRP